MNILLALWLPILVTAVLVFIASSLIHMVFKWHNSDYRKLANEDEVTAALRTGAPAPGQYIVPHCNDMKEMQDEAMQKKYRDGPVGILTLKSPGPPAMGAALAKWFALNVLVAAIVAAVAAQLFGLSGEAHRASQVIGVLTFLTYAGGSVQAGIWMGKPWASVGKDLLDGAIYAIISAITFRMLWP